MGPLPLHEHWSAEMTSEVLTAREGLALHVGARDKAQLLVDGTTGGLLPSHGRAGHEAEEHRG